MVNRTLLHSLEPSSAEWERELSAAFSGMNAEELDEIIAGFGEEEDILPNKIVDGRVVRVDDEMVVVDVGYKCEGTIPISEWSDLPEKPKVGDVVKVLIEDIEDAHFGATETQDMLLLSKRKAEKILDWERLMNSTKEGDVVTGLVTRKIKGGLLVDIGVSVFLPASQVDIRRPADIGDYIERTIQCVVLKIDDARRNIVVSRRALIEAPAHAADRPVAQGRGQEHCRLRGFRRSGRDRRAVAYHRHELGPRQPSLGESRPRSRARGDDPRHRL